MRNFKTRHGTPVDARERASEPTTQTVLAFDDNRLASAPVRPIRTESRVDRAQARRGRRLARQSCHHRRLARSLRPGASRARSALRAAQARRRARRPAMSKARSGRRSRKARCSTTTRRPRVRISKRSICASARCARAPRDRTPISARSSAMRWCSAPARPAPARPGSRSRYAVSLFERKEVDRIILSRPAVEAGERLGFLPGDMREKVDPYLRPIYDALFDLMDTRIVERALQAGEIEIAPLAFMRGRTLAQRGRHSRRSAEHDIDADEDVPDPARREQPHDRDGRSEPGRSAARARRPDLPKRSRLLADVEGIGHVAFTRRRRHPPRTRGADRRRL